jgi:hypothetical protein
MAITFFAVDYLFSRNTMGTGILQVKFTSEVVFSIVGASVLEAICFTF